MSDQTLTMDRATAWLEAFRQRVEANKGYLTELDSAIGDADHGTNMVRGMEAAMTKIADEPPITMDALFKGAGMTLVSTVGGASGPLYGTFLLRFGMTAGAVDHLDGTGVAGALRAGLQGIVDRGKAEPEDKTMFDALAPGLDAFDAALANSESLSDAARAAAAAAAVGRDATEPWVARKGRASYLGERSAGHIDPGAASSVLLLDALAEALEP